MGFLTMSLRQIEKLYLRMIRRTGSVSTINTAVRSEIFSQIMSDVERLQKKLRQTAPGSREHHSLDGELRQLMLKEIQVIIDDYIIARQNGTLDRWQRMYGDISGYIRNYYRYREAAGGRDHDHGVDAYGFFDQDGAPHKPS